MDTNTTDRSENPAAPGVGSGALFGNRHPGHMGYAYATDPSADQVIGLFDSREEAIANLLSDNEHGGWISAVRAVTENDENAEDGWDFICYGPRETVKPNIRSQPHAEDKA